MTVGSAATLPTNYPRPAPRPGDSLPGLSAPDPHPLHPPKQPGPSEDLFHRRGHRLRQRPEHGRRVCGPEGALRLLEGQRPPPAGEAVWSLSVFFLTMWDHQNPRSDFRLFRPRTQPPVPSTGGIVIPYTDTPRFLRHRLRRSPPPNDHQGQAVPLPHHPLPVH